MHAVSSFFLPLPSSQFHKSWRLSIHNNSLELLAPPPTSTSLPLILLYVLLPYRLWRLLPLVRYIQCHVSHRPCSINWRGGQEQEQELDSLHLRCLKTSHRYRHSVRFDILFPLLSAPQEAVAPVAAEGRAVRIDKMHRDPVPASIQQSGDLWSGAAHIKLVINWSGKFSECVARRAVNAHASRFGIANGRRLRLGLGLGMGLGMGWGRGTCACLVSHAGLTCFGGSSSSSSSSCGLRAFEFLIYYMRDSSCSSRSSGSSIAFLIWVMWPKTVLS